MKSKKGLKPNMLVRNIITGKIGKLLRNPRNHRQVYDCAEFCVHVGVISADRKRRRRFWRIENIERHKQSLSVRKKRIFSSVDKFLEFLESRKHT